MQLTVEPGWACETESYHINPGLKLITVLWLVTPDAMAQNCQVVVSRPEIQLGKQIHVANAGTLFTQQEMTVAAECVGTGPITLLIDGTPDEGDNTFALALRAA